GFWVLANQPLVDSSSVVAVELSEQGTYSIPLHSGWNIISNPTEKDMAWAGVQQANDISQPLWSFLGGNYQQPDTLASARAGGQAYYYFNQEEKSQLQLPYAPNRLPGTESSRSKTKEETKAWRIQLTATQPGGEHPNGYQTTVRVGGAAKARDGFDHRDAVAPPGRFEAISMYLLPADFEESSTKLAREYRPFT
ncbi:hypothetical protein NC796_26425, partial [Aliifodinibius sp. S!AR15-10]